VEGAFYEDTRRSGPQNKRGRLEREGGGRERDKQGRNCRSVKEN